MKSLHFDNRFVRELPGDPRTDSQVRQVQGACYSRVAPTPVAAPRLLAWAPEVAALVGFDVDDVGQPAFADVFGGNALMAGMAPYAACYGGHQFGNWAGQLGDGRAIGLGEVVNGAGERWELQLKGAGRTPYSRGADGRAVLRSSIREFLCSEAMHHLGVPTTRALSLVATGEAVMRDMFYDGNARAEPGAVVCRVAPSFIRFGHFELPASRGDTALLTRLIDFTISRDFPDLLAGAPMPDGAERDALCGAWFGRVCERTAVMVAHWMRVGFVHGVMNTDNMSILGLTIDYGPYGWIDHFDPGWTPNTTDAGGRRYRFGNQPAVAHWNLVRLANALYTVLPSPEPLQAGLDRFVSVYEDTSRAMYADKLGLLAFGEADVALLDRLHALLTAQEVDMTLFFRCLAAVNLHTPSVQVFDEAFYDARKAEQGQAALQSWLADYAQRVLCDGEPAEARRARMNAANPLYVMRNYLAQQAIDQAEQGDLSGVETLLDVMRHPYQRQPGREAYAQKRPDWARHRAGCSMLSCSS